MANEFTRQRVAKVTYDFSTDVTVGAVGTITPSGSDEIPKNAIITGFLQDVQTIVTGGGGCTIQITGGGLNLTDATTLAQGEFDAASVLWRPATGNDETTAVYVPAKATSTAPLKVVVGSAAVTAGKFDIYVFYVA